MNHCPGVDDACLEMLATLTQLKGLQVSNCQAITNHGVEKLCSLQDLEKLCIQSCVNVSDPFIQCLSQNCP